MPVLTPPPRPPRRVALGENDGLRQLRRRLWQLNVSVVTVFFTAWCCTLGPVPAVIALMVAKDVMVALVLMALGYPQADGH